MVDLHPIKQETFDIQAKTNTDPKGIIRPVDHYNIMQGALYMARSADHPRFHYLESWLIPPLDMRITWFHFRDNIAPTQELYVDVAHIDSSDQQVWTTRDLYVDVVTHRGGRIQVLDLDELGAALAEGYIGVDDANRALRASQRILDGINLHGSLQGWLAQEGYQLAWQSPMSTAKET
ncbi:DUF402 domain-containing protein [Corynebacterium anserum]|uniref:DUF402 domain-containing protein n=1 Tax=Corynebacterium anserum TaxID=2684406 RepID=A0A7G7YPB1_9CORY|nr:DUF402 domain-containing protein [Corynebacterium anserum]MBC2681939.1 DUF402 domain-containing protein [Corynebacterium anserum]QNH96331.1 DUF402 domain-containing protein [Corynebacterium anserum]